jgi:hypothetical protein
MKQAGVWVPAAVNLEKRSCLEVLSQSCVGQEGFSPVV